MSDEDNGDESSETPRLSVNQSPGNFYLFWNVLVPLSVLFNIRRFGLRIHELGLILALLLNPYLLNKIIQYPLVTWLVVIFLIIWIERVLRRWAWYKIYSFSFLRSLFLLMAFIAIPSLILTFVWRPLQAVMPRALESLNPDWDHQQMTQLRDVIMVVLAMGILFHSIYFYSQTDHCIATATYCRWKEYLFPKCCIKKAKCNKYYRKCR